MNVSIISLKPDNLAGYWTIPDPDTIQCPVSGIRGKIEGPDYLVSGIWGNFVGQTIRCPVSGKI